MNYLIMLLKQKNNNRTALCLLALCCLITSACLSVASKPGLTVENGQLMRNGSEFRAMGINYNTAWYDVLKKILRPWRSRRDSGF